MKLNDLHQLNEKTELPTKTFTIEVKGDCISSFEQLLEAISKSAGQGAGIDITASTGDGDIASCSIDGDGVDRITIK